MIGNEVNIKEHGKLLNIGFIVWVSWETFEESVWIILWGEMKVMCLYLWYWAWNSWNSSFIWSRVSMTVNFMPAWPDTSGAWKHTSIVTPKLLQLAYYLLFLHCNGIALLITLNGVIILVISGGKYKDRWKIVCSVLHLTHPMWCQGSVTSV